MPPEAPATSAQSGPSESWSSRLRRPLSPAATDVAIALVCAELVLLAHDVTYLLSAPYWLDEAWVALSTRLPLSDLPLATGHSPAGWMLLLRAIPFGGLQRHRVLALFFSGAAVSVGYGLGRALGWPRFVAFCYGACASLLSPPLLEKNDLKQYSADAFVVIALLFLVVRLENAWAPRRLVHLAIAAALAPLISSAAYFFDAAAMAAVVVACLAARERARVRAAVIATAAAGATNVAILVALFLPNENPLLRNNWRDNYPPLSPKGFVEFVARHSEYFSFSGVHSAAGVGILLALGVYVLLASRRIASGLMIPFAIAFCVIAGFAHQYPLMDRRTGTALLFAFDLGMAIGVAGLCVRLVHAKGLAAKAGGAVVFAGGLLGMAVAARPFFRAHLLPPEDMREQAEYIAAHKHPGDVIVLDPWASYGFAYYSGTHFTIVRTDTMPNGFLLRFPDDPLIFTTGAEKDLPSIARTMDQAELAAHKTPGARIWIARDHEPDEVQDEWSRVLTARRARPILEGMAPLAVGE